METLLSLIGSPVNAVTFFVASGVLFFQMVDRGLIKIGKNNKERVPLWAQRLDAYYNHNTTKQNTEILGALSKLNDRIESHNTMEQESLYILKDIKEDLRNGAIKCSK